MVMVGEFRDCVTGFVSTFNIFVGFSLLALRALLSVDDLPASRRREPSEERTNLHHIDFDGIFFFSFTKGEEKKDLNSLETSKLI